ncbi:MAG: LarC family nickel insertion protein [Lawsonibacter sp.]|nr:LarC family nickel insertion protein [Lawsonibacter sp.]
MDEIAHIVDGLKLPPQQVIVSPIHVGSGQVRCAHGILPVPAPATAHLLRGVPIYGGEVYGKLCTPTGAALLTHFATSFGEIPVMRTQAIGYGMGKKNFDRANCVRALMGETEEHSETVTKLSCNLDDMTGEDNAFAMERLFDGGALEVYTVPVGMKKSRPGTLLCVLCSESEKEAIVRLIFRHTTTLGIRETTYQRHTLTRAIVPVETPFGPVRQKQSYGYEVTRAKFEFEDIAQIAKENNLSLLDVRARIERQN